MRLCMQLSTLLSTNHHRWTSPVTQTINASHIPSIIFILIRYQRNELRTENKRSGTYIVRLLCVIVFVTEFMVVWLIRWYDISVEFIGSVFIILFPFFTFIICSISTVPIIYYCHHLFDALRREKSLCCKLK